MRGVKLPRPNRTRESLIQPPLNQPSTNRDDRAPLTARPRRLAGRYNDGRRHVAAIASGLYNSAALAFNFDNGTDAQAWGPRGAFAAQQAALAGGALDPAALAFRRDYAHLVSLLHAACLAWLRCDPDPGNLRPHDRAAPPAWDST